MKVKNIKLDPKKREIRNMMSNKNSINRNGGNIIFNNIKKNKVSIPESIKVNYIICSNKIKGKIESLRNISSIRNKLTKKPFKPIYKNSSSANTFYYLNSTFDKNLFLSK